MNVVARVVLGGAVVSLAMFVYVSLSPTTGWDNSSSAQSVTTRGRTYVGTSKCAPCHFPQFKQWKEDRHAKSFEILPAKYRKDANCLKCHSTGYGEPSGYVDESTASLAGTTCEACHGPGSEHVTVAQRFVEVELTPEGEQQLRATIQKVKPENACVQCHLSKAHKDPHPEYDKES